MTTDKMPPLPEPIKEVSVAGYNDGILRPALEEYFDAEQMREYALATLRLAQSGGWQPIESAPKDELALFRIQWSEIPVVGSWDGRTFSANSEHHAVSCGAYCYGGMVGTERGTVPTHWQPLPAPPRRPSARPFGE